MMTGPQSDAPSDAPQEWRNFYGRRFGKTLRPAQKESLGADLGRLRLPGVSIGENPDRRPLDPAAVFGGASQVWLEIGFGGGEHMVHLAGRYPDVGIMGCEPFINGVAMLLGKVQRAGLTNLAIHPGDVRDLFDVLPGGSIARAFLNYPDPWPKRRHHRRRFVTSDHLQPLARVLAPGAAFHIATDIPDYVRQALDAVPPAGFSLLSHRSEPWEDWLPTRYERKALREGRRPQYLTFGRL